MVGDRTLRQEEVAAELEYWLRDDRFLIAVDAYDQGYGNLYDLVYRVEQQVPLSMHDLGHFQMMQVVIAATKKLKSGELVVRDEIKRKYSEFYSQTEAGDEWGQWMRDTVYRRDDPT